ncbi:hypothetical protein Agub_g5280 [Astrephomene gubernaculifera]|uniref:Uncharacterized protein n=1 Tax=Astrephomene gubernaculifera TaxID=47775 RepID=A0AAD3DNR0_9CHLO|nr:hypothetical protein Agub_g5280 [Astrephomene gubernaculifera]
MGSGSSCAKLDIVSEEEIHAAIKAITDWEEAQKAEQKASQALRTVRKDSFKRAANELNHHGGIVDRIGGPDRVHDIIQVFYRKLFSNPEVRHFFEHLSTERMRAKQMKFMRYIMGGPGTYTGNLRCVHARMVLEGGLDLPTFQVVEGLLVATLQELHVPQDVIDDVNRNVESAKTAIFTPNPDELVSNEEMAVAASEMKHPLITRLGGPQAVQAIIQAFYKKLFRCEELKYFFASLSAERLRNMQFKFMRYLFCGPASYAETGGNMRCVHARMVKEDGLDIRKFNMVVQMLVDVMNDQMVSHIYAREVLANVQAAKSAIFTPGPDELVGREEVLAEVAAAGLAGGQLLGRLGGPERLWELVSGFYAKLFGDEQLKYYFALTSDRLRTKQLRLMRYLIGGPAAYAALGGSGGGLRCKHLALIRDKGLDGPKFDRMVRLLKGVMEAMKLPEDAVSEILANVEAARSAIFTPGPEELISREELVTAAEALKSETVSRLGGPQRVYSVISTFYSKLFNDAELKYFFVSLSDKKLRTKQFKLMSYLFGGPAAYVATTPGGNLRCSHARLIKEYGMDASKFDRVAGMMLETLREENAPEDVIAAVLLNVQSAKSAIFTPGPDELVGREEVLAEVAAAGLAGGPLLGRLGGPERLWELVSGFYAKLFGDEQLKYYFGSLTSERLKNKQLKFMRCLVGGTKSYSGDLRCAHAPMLPKQDGGDGSGSGGGNSSGGGGLDAAAFNRLIAHLTSAAKEMDVRQDALAEMLQNVEAARKEILGDGRTGAGAANGGGNRPASAVRSAAAAAVASPNTGAAAGVAALSLYERLGGECALGLLVDSLHERLLADPRVAHLYKGVNMFNQRRQQLAFMRTALSTSGSATPAAVAVGGIGGVGSRPSSASSTPTSLTLGIAYAHLARDKALSAEGFEAVAMHLVACLNHQGASPDLVAAVRAMMQPGKSLLFPPVGAGGGGGCPFARSISAEDEQTLDAIMVSAYAPAAAAGSSAAEAASFTATKATARPQAAASTASSVAVAEAVAVAAGADGAAAVTAPAVAAGMLAADGTAAGGVGGAGASPTLTLSRVPRPPSSANGTGNGYAGNSGPPSRTSSRRRIYIGAGGGGGDVGGSGGGVTGAAAAAAGAASPGGATTPRGVGNGDEVPLRLKLAQERLQLLQQESAAVSPQQADDMNNNNNNSSSSSPRTVLAPYSPRTSAGQLSSSPRSSSTTTPAVPRLVLAPSSSTPTPDQAACFSSSASSVPAPSVFACATRTADFAARSSSTGNLTSLADNSNGTLAADAAGTTAIVGNSLAFQPTPPKPRSVTPSPRPTGRLNSSSSNRISNSSLLLSSSELRPSAASITLPTSRLRPSASSFLGSSPRPSGPSVLGDEDEALAEAIMMSEPHILLSRTEVEA